MAGTQYEIWVDDSIKEASLEELAQMTMFKSMKGVWFIERKGKKMLINFFLDTSHRILNDGTHVLKRAATGVLFAEVKKHKRMLVYDHIKEILSYTDKLGEIKRSEATTHIFPVLRYPDDVAEAVADMIVKKEKI
jgi:hypothetical protein